MPYAVKYKVFEKVHPILAEAIVSAISTLILEFYKVLFTFQSTDFNLLILILLIIFKVITVIKPFRFWFWKTENVKYLQFAHKFYDVKKWSAY